MKNHLGNRLRISYDLVMSTITFKSVPPEAHSRPKQFGAFSRWMDCCCDPDS